MSSPQRRPHDPFETLVELTAAAMSGRPPRDFVFEPAGPSIVSRIADFLHRVRLPHMEAGVDAANDPTAEELKLLQRYY
ncbi:MAG: hypothetical protein KJ018_14435 [Burkholderiales bacterium]|nr:hypothetical protein [Burkholderiales bacterium]